MFLTQDGDTCAAVESQLCGGVKFLNEELRQRDPVICVQGFVAFFPVQHQVVIRVRVCWRHVGNKDNLTSKYRKKKDKNSNSHNFFPKVKKQAWYF